MCFFSSVVVNIFLCCLQFDVTFEFLTVKARNRDLYGNPDNAKAISKFSAKVTGNSRL